MHHVAQIPFSRPATPDVQSPRRRLGFLGLGNLGQYMARNLATSSHSRPAGSPPLLVYSRTRSKAESLLQAIGKATVQIAETAGQLAVNCDVIITSLPSDESVRAIYEEFSVALRQMPPTAEKIFVETGTTFPALASEMERLLSEFQHVRYVTCPVFGLPPVADRAQLLLAVSGPYQARKKIANLLCPAIGRKVLDLGESPEKAPMFKLLGNSMVVGCVEAMVETFTLAEKTDIGANTVLELVKDMLPAPPLLLYGEKMTKDLFDGTKGFDINGAIKDVGFMRRVATAHDCSIQAVDAAHDNLLTARSLHRKQLREGRADWEVLDASAIVVGGRAKAGLQGQESA